MSGSTCTSDDISCYCTPDNGLRGVSAACLQAKCTVKELLSALNVTAVMCDDPVRDRGPRTKLMALIFAPIALVTLILRLGIKAFGKAGGYGWDDYTIIICAVCPFQVGIRETVPLLTMPQVVTIPYIWSVYTGEELSTLPLVETNNLLFNKLCSMA